MPRRTPEQLVALVDWARAPHAALGCVAKAVCLLHRGAAVLPAAACLLERAQPTARIADRADSRILVLHWARACLASEGRTGGTALHVEAWRDGEERLHVSLTACTVCDGVPVAEGRGDAVSEAPARPHDGGEADGAAASASGRPSERRLPASRPVLSASSLGLPAFTHEFSLRGPDAASGAVLASRPEPLAAASGLDEEAAALAAALAEAVGDLKAALRRQDAQAGAAARQAVVLSCSAPSQRAAVGAAWSGAWDAGAAEALLWPCLSGLADALATERRVVPLPAAAGAVPHAAAWIGASALAGVPSVRSASLPIAAVLAMGLPDPAALDAADQWAGLREAAAKLDAVRSAAGRATVTTAGGERTPKPGAVPTLPGGNLLMMLGTATPGAAGT